MRIETTPWIVVLFGWVPLALGGLVQDHRHIDAGYTPAMQPLLGTNPLNLSPSPKENQTNVKPPAPQMASAQPAVVSDRSLIDFEQSGVMLQHGESPLDTYAPRLDSSDPLPMPSFSDSTVSHAVEGPVSVPLPAMLWPGLIALSIGALLRRAAVATQRN